MLEITYGVQYQGQSAQLFEQTASILSKRGACIHLIYSSCI